MVSSAKDASTATVIVIFLIFFSQSGLQQMKHILSWTEVRCLTWLINSIPLLGHKTSGFPLMYYSPAAFGEYVLNKFCVLLMDVDLQTQAL